MHASRGPFFTCARRCALADGCKNEPQHAGIRACISGSVLHLSPQVCTCRRLQKRTAARRCKIMHFRVRSSPVPGGVHLQKAAKNEQQHAGFHLSCSLLGDGVRGVCPCGNGKCKDFAATPVVACVQMGEASKTRNATTKARISSCCCCCWQHVRLPPRGVVRFLCWHVLKLEFWHFARPKLNLRFVFASVFAVFSSKKCNSRRAALYKNMLSSPFRIVFFRCFPLCVAFRISFLPTLDFLPLPASTCICFCLSALCGGGGGGGGAVMTSMRMRLVFSVSFVASYVCRISHRFLRCFCRLSTFCTCQLRLAFVFQLCAGVGGGDGGGGDDVHANAACVFCFFCCVTSQTLPVAL